MAVNAPPPTYFPNKFSFETPITSMDFGPLIAAQSPGATIDTMSPNAPVVTIVWYSGPDSTAQSMLSGSVSVSGTKVIQQIQGGLVGNTYLVTYQITLSTGELFQEQRLIKITEFI